MKETRLVKATYEVETDGAIVEVEIKRKDGEEIMDFFARCKTVTDKVSDPKEKPNT